jgi:hypothetical protein
LAQAREQHAAVLVMATPSGRQLVGHVPDTCFVVPTKGQLRAVCPGFDPRLIVGSVDMTPTETDILGDGGCSGQGEGSRPMTTDSAALLMPTTDRE